MDLKQLGFIHSACGPLLKTIQKLFRIYSKIYANRKYRLYLQE